MITPQYAETMAVYNRWQNRNICGAAGRLSDAERKRDLGAFFGSIHATLYHILRADQAWMHRFAGTPKPLVGTIPESVGQYEDWNDFMAAREAFDETIIAWAGTLTPEWLREDLSWCSGAMGREIVKPRWLLVTQVFNHQTHHRGQVHCLLTQAGLRPGDTDLPFMPE